MWNDKTVIKWRSADALTKNGSNGGRALRRQAASTCRPRADSEPRERHTPRTTTTASEPSTLHSPDHPVHHSSSAQGEPYILINCNGSVLLSLDPTIHYNLQNDEHQTITTPATTVVTPEEPFRHFLPAVLFVVTFVMVITTLLIYMDNTGMIIILTHYIQFDTKTFITSAMRQQQFRQNMRHDEVLAKVSQDDDVLVAYIRQWQLSSAAKPFPPHSRHPPLPPEPLPLIPTPTESVVAELLKHKVSDCDFTLKLPKNQSINSRYFSATEYSWK